MLAARDPKHIATGKLLKARLREQYRIYRLPDGYGNCATLTLTAESALWLSIRQGGCRQA
jgi:hypothetical protein